MQLKVPLAPVTVPAVGIGRLVGFILGAVTVLSLIGIALAGATNGFGWRREIISSKKVAEDLYRVQARTTPGWLMWLFGASTRSRDYLVSMYRRTNNVEGIETPDGRQFPHNGRLARMVILFNRENGLINER